jgi:hypothetical protein
VKVQQFGNEPAVSVFKMMNLPALLIALVVVLGSALPPAPLAASVASIEYADIDQAGRHRAAIDALQEAGILAGTECDPAGFCPDLELPRWVMAVWVVRALGEQEPPPVEASRFSDIDGDVWWARYVQRFAELGITGGCDVNPDRFCPQQPVTRGQMAVFLTRAFDLAGNLDAEGADTVKFADTEGSPHARYIQALAVSNITVGCATDPLRYCPHRPVSRAEMATFLARALNLVSIVEYTPDADGDGFLHLVSQYTTYHPCCQARVTNIQLFADLMDGEVVPPNGRFSLNRHVGERTEAKGFLRAGTLVGGELINTVGGGVSQFATTFYNAVFWGGYQDIFHQPHSRYFSRYPEGVEATLDWPSLDVIFRNDSSSNVLIRASYTKTSLTVKLFGDNDGRVVVGEWKNGRPHLEVIAEGGDQARVVTAEVSSRQDPVAPPAPLYRSNPDLSPGEEKYLQPSLGGWTVKVTRTVTQGGNLNTQWWVVRYSPLRAIIEVHPCVIVQSCPPQSN